MRVVPSSWDVWAFPNPPPEVEVMLESFQFFIDLEIKSESDLG